MPWAEIRHEYHFLLGVVARARDPTWEASKNPKFPEPSGLYIEFVVFPGKLGSPFGNYVLLIIEFNN